VQQITVRDYPIHEVARRLGEFAFIVQVAETVRRAGAQVGRGDHEAENRRLKRELARVTGERDILTKGEPWIATGSRAMANAYFAQDAK
jgi:transposase